MSYGNQSSINGPDLRDSLSRRMVVGDLIAFEKSIKKLFICEGEILFFQVAMPVNIYSILDYLDYRLLKSRW